MRAALFSLFLLLLLLLTSGLSPARAEPPPFRQGVNLSHWLQYTGRQPVNPADMRLIAKAGFDHVRIPFDPDFLGWLPGGAEPLPKVALLENAVDMALAAGLAVIVDFHPEASLEASIESNAGTREAFLRLWTWLAARLANRPADRVAFEILNEPQYYNRPAAAWDQLQHEAVRAIRRVAPENRLLLTGIHGSGIAGLERLTPVADPHILYVFHFYDPQLLTHQGANWPPYPERAEGMMRGLVYPAAEMSLAKVELRPGADIGLVTQSVRQYLDAGWGAETIRGRIDVARQWARRQHTELFATEFGALRGSLSPLSRIRWLADVRKALDDASIGWTVWDYADLFGVAETTGAVERLDDGTAIALDGTRIERRFDPEILKALGLRP